MILKSENLTGNIESYFFERNGSNAKFYRNGTEIYETPQLNAVLPQDNGAFILGAYRPDGV